MWVFLTPNIHLIQPSDTRLVSTWVWGSVQHIEAAVGHGFSIVGQNYDAWRWRFGLDGGTFMTFEPGGTLTFHLMTFDGTFGLPFDLRIDRWVFRTEWRHDSAHFGDGVRYASQKPPPSSLDIYSLESLALFAGYAGMWGQPQVGARWVYHAVNEAPTAVLQAGLQLEWDGLERTPYVSITGKQPIGGLGHPSLSGQIGLRLEQDWAFRCGLQGYVGGNDAGRLTQQREQRLGLWFSWSPDESSWL